MSVVIETTIGDITVDLFVKERPRCCLNFLKLCQIKYYNFCVFHYIQHNFIAQSGDPTGTGSGGDSVFLQLYGENGRMFEMETKPKIKHRRKGLVSMVNNGEGLHGSQFFITLADELDYLDGKHTVFGEVAEGMEVLDKFNEVLCDTNHKPYKDILITHTVILDDPFPQPKNLEIPPQSPEINEEFLKSDRIGVLEDVDDTDGMTAQEIDESIRDKEAKERALVLEMIGDIPDAEVKPPENVLFVCKLNPVTREDDLEVIFSRFGTIVSCEVIRDQKSGESLQYAFIEFDNEEDCEKAYFKMDNVLIDDRRIHVDFSQSVSKIKWFGKGKGVTIVKDFKDKKDDKSGDQFRLKNSALGQRTDAKYNYVYDKDEYQVMLPKISHKSSNNSPERDRHHKNRHSRHLRSRSRDRDKDREHRDRHRDRDSDRNKDKDRDRYRERNKYTDRDNKRSHGRHEYRTDSKRNRSPSPERSNHSRSNHRSRH
ncbi:peptidyl-prolyl cis-trans isomerase sig-7-like [Oppia nitens]|uniref:peptidyl-prolyl cis-trans isomerase sig-7-like n=1 Tax=Oppia nitens TaxID=1686743 RepID=UPI0023DC30D7|nr:peptidyl-prolyl cis-trans isomerase sig-7-like [Oppia nitens]